MRSHPPGWRRGAGLQPLRSRRERQAAAKTHKAMLAARERRWVRMLGGLQDGYSPDDGFEHRFVPHLTRPCSPGAGAGRGRYHSDRRRDRAWRQVTPPYTWVQVLVPRLAESLLHEAGERDEPGVARFRSTSCPTRSTAAGRARSGCAPGGVRIEAHLQPYDRVDAQPRG
jgi:hypothetical protein